MTSVQISWFSDFVSIFYICKNVRSHVRGRASWTRCSKFIFVSKVYPQTGLRTHVYPQTDVRKNLKGWKWKKYSLPCAPFLAHDKELFAECFIRGTRQTVDFVECGHQTLGKMLTAAAWCWGASANADGCMFAEGGTRKIKALPCVAWGAHGKDPIRRVCCCRARGQGHTT
jgi:hypothetical protein